MTRRARVEVAGLVGVATILATGAGAAWAGGTHPTRTAAQSFTTAPRTWHVIAGFSQLLPHGRGSTTADGS